MGLELLDILGMINSGHLNKMLRELDWNPNRKLVIQ